MTEQKFNELKNLAHERMRIAKSFIDESAFIGSLKKGINEEAEIPGFENKNPKFGQFTNKEFVAMMTDIRDSTAIVNSDAGVSKMFKIFYVYSAVVANIVDTNSGTSTEFLGDGILNLYDTEEKGLGQALMNAMQTGWDILHVRSTILNPLFIAEGLPTINLGVGIAHGVTIVTRFGFKQDNDLKAFGKCVYDVSQLSKGMNSINVAQATTAVWPIAQNGRLGFQQHFDTNSSSFVYQAYLN